jgi:hypothetical protein
MAERPAGAPPFLEEVLAKSKSKWGKLKADDMAKIKELIA